jgi:hypothetical protein
MEQGKMDNVYLVINIEQRTRRVMQIGLSLTPIVIANEGRLNLVGDIAQWLYIALTGHRYDEPPKRSSLIQANAARAHIQARQHTKPGWRIAYEVISQWGLHIQPWLGCLIEQDGKIVEDVPEYRLLFDLVTGRAIPPVCQGWLWVSGK